mgnify:CR=1 FL=1
MHHLFTFLNNSILFNKSEKSNKLDSLISSAELRVLKFVVEGHTNSEIAKKLNLSKQNIKLDKSQAVASIGQIELMNLFNKIFSSKKINLSQILLTLEDTEQRLSLIHI